MEKLLGRGLFTILVSMKKSKYEKRAMALGQAIDIAISSIKKFPPEDFDEEDIQQFIDVYLETKELALNPEKRYANLESLSYEENGILIYFREGSGKAVEFFWKKIKEEKLPYKRTNLIKKILKRKKIKNMMEYEYIMDVFLPYQEEGIITKKQVDLLNKLIVDFEIE